MSELTPCNFCTLRRITAMAEKNGKQIIVTGASDSRYPTAKNVYVVPKDETLKPGTEPVIWFMSLTDHCVC